MLCCWSYVVLITHARSLSTPKYSHFFLLSEREADYEFLCMEQCRPPFICRGISKVNIYYESIFVRTASQIMRNERTQQLMINTVRLHWQLPSGFWRGDVDWKFCRIKWCLFRQLFRTWRGQRRSLPALRHWHLQFSPQRLHVRYSRAQTAQCRRRKPDSNVSRSSWLEDHIKNVHHLHGMIFKSSAYCRRTKNIFSQ